MVTSKLACGKIGKSDYLSWLNNKIAWRRNSVLQRLAGTLHLGPIFTLPINGQALRFSGSIEDNERGVVGIFKCGCQKIGVTA